MRLRKGTVPSYAELSAWRMRQGPRILDDGIALIIPSEPGWTKAEASALWKRAGFRWDRENYVCRRDVRQPAKGRQYTREAWLAWACRRFGEHFAEIYNPSQ